MVDAPAVGWGTPLKALPEALRGPEGAISVSLFIVLALLPFGDAGRSVPSWGLNAVAFGVLVMARELVSLRPGAQPGVPVMRFLVPGGLFVAVVLWCTVQEFPVPSWFGHPVWALAGEALGSDLPARLTIDPEATSLATLRLLTAACAFWVAAHLAADVTRALIILHVVVAISAMVSIYGLWTTASDGLALSGASSAAVVDRVGEPFGNRNSFATYAGMGFIVALALLWRRYQIPAEQFGSARRRILVGLLQGSAGVGALLISASLLLVAGVIASGSRGAMLATGLAVAVLAILMMAGRNRTERRRNAAIALVSVAGLGVALLTFGDLVISRLGQVGLYDQGRGTLAQTTIAAVQASPWFGYGHGTFPAVFPMFRDDPASIWTRWTSAHNVYLETTVELGLPAAMLLFAAVGWIVWDSFKGAVIRKRYRTVPAAAASAAVLALVHASVDFSLSVQAVSLNLAIILGVGFAQSVRPSSGASVRHPDRDLGGLNVTSARRRGGFA